MQKIARIYQIYPAQVSVWKKQLLDDVSGIFGSKKDSGKDYKNEND